MLVLGLIAPVTELMLKPDVEVNVPPVYASVPFRVTAWPAPTDIQKGVPA